MRARWSVLGKCETQGEVGEGSVGGAAPAYPMQTFPVCVYLFDGEETTGEMWKWVGCQFCGTVLFVKNMARHLRQSCWV